MRLPCSLLPFILLVLAPVASAGEKEKALFTEAFTDKLADGWTWVREDAKGWRLDKGTLIVRTSTGGLWQKDNNGGNILLRTPPEVKDGKLAVEVLVDVEPTNVYENAGLIWYYDDDNYVIMVKEKIDKDVLMQLVAEQDGKPKAGFHKKFNEGKSVWVRMEVEGGKITGRYRVSPKDDWQTVGQCALPVRGQPKVGLTTAYAPKDAEHFTRFSNFRMLHVKKLSAGD
jgi:regulation of enolase protein 1 (concanavalin A-like superfamily)